MHTSRRDCGVGRAACAGKSLIVQGRLLLEARSYSSQRGDSFGSFGARDVDVTQGEGNDQNSPRSLRRFYNVALAVLVAGFLGSLLVLLMGGPRRGDNAAAAAVTCTYLSLVVIVARARDAGKLSGGLAQVITAGGAFLLLGLVALVILLTK